MEKINLITKEGYDRLKKELDHLKNVERPNISEAVGAARELGDLRENAEYHTGRERQAQIEARIKIIEDILINSEVFDVSVIKDTKTVSFSATVKIEDLDSGDVKTLKLVGENESDIRNGLISISSPLGSNLMNKKIGDCVTVEAPSGIKEYEVLEVKY